MLRSPEVMKWNVIYFVSVGGAAGFLCSNLKIAFCRFSGPGPDFKWETYFKLILNRLSNLQQPTNYVKNGLTDFQQS